MNFKKKKKKVDSCLLLFLLWARVRGYKEWRERAARGLDPSNVARKWQEIDIFFHENAKKIAQNMMCLKDTDTFDWQFKSPSISLEIWVTDDT